jgi:hypothetical protein
VKCLCNTSIFNLGKHVGIPIPPIKSNFFLPTQKLYKIRQGFYGGLPFSDELLYNLFTESICSIDKYVGRLLPFSTCEFPEIVKHIGAELFIRLSIFCILHTEQ